jgi:hypothetical protein
VLLWLNVGKCGCICNSWLGVFCFCFRFGSISVPFRFGLVSFWFRSVSVPFRFGSVSVRFRFRSVPFRFRFGFLSFQFRFVSVPFHFHLGSVRFRFGSFSVRFVSVPFRFGCFPFRFRSVTSFMSDCRMTEFEDVRNDMCVCMCVCTEKRKCAYNVFSGKTARKIPLGRHWHGVDYYVSGNICGSASFEHGNELADYVKCYTSWETSFFSRSTLLPIVFAVLNIFCKFANPLKYFRKAIYLPSTDLVAFIFFMTACASKRISLAFVNLNTALIQSLSFYAIYAE